MASKEKKYLNQAGLAYFFARLKEIFVQEEEGKGLSSNDFTDEYKDRVDTLDPADVVMEDDALSEEEIDEILNSADEADD